MRSTDSMAPIFESDFRASDIEFAKLEGRRSLGANFYHADGAGADFRGAKGRRDFEGIDLKRENQRLPRRHIRQGLNLDRATKISPTRAIFPAVIATTASNPD